MAESDIDVLEDIPSLFVAASSHVRSIAGTLGDQALLDFYSLYKQAEEGPCKRPKPSWFQMTEKQKWEAWCSLKNLDKETAMKRYVELLNKLDPKWQENLHEKTTSWVHHSCLQNNEEQLSDNNKNIFDWVKEDNLPKVKSSASNLKIVIDGLDDDGLSLLHWAADRGSLQIVQYFIESLKANVNVQDIDGQTPLHYAVSCGHTEVAQFLLQNGADLTIVDSDQRNPVDVASTPQMKDLLEQFVTN